MSKRTQHRRDARQRRKRKQEPRSTFLVGEDHAQVFLVDATAPGGGKG